MIYVLRESRGMRQLQLVKKVFPGSYVQLTKAGNKDLEEV